MDARHFDALTRVFSAAGTRRCLLAVLTTLPVVGALTGGLSPEDGEAKDRRRRRKQRHSKRKHPGNRKGGCKPKGKGKICAGTCGPVKNSQTCGKTVDCGSCDCAEACKACFVCDPTTRTCVPDPDQVGDACGTPGQVCASDGTCACTQSSCPACQQCGADGTCTGCDGCCDGKTCVTDCGECRTCGEDGQCGLCPGCCDSSGACQPGDTNEACGYPGEACSVCTGRDECRSGACVCQPTSCRAEGKNCGLISDGCTSSPLDCGSCVNPTPICASNVCAACGSDTECGANHVCCNGSCFEGVCCSDAACEHDAKPDCVGHACTCKANGDRPCADGLGCCAGGCIDIQNSHDHCGACDNACDADQLCVAGVCTACTVTCTAGDHQCSGDALQTAIAAGGTVLVCPGKYTGNFTVEGGASVAIIGAGMDEDPATNTILATSRGRNLNVDGATSFSLTAARILGYDEASQCLQNGISIKDSLATFARCAIRNIGTKFCTQGFTITGLSTVNLNNSVVSGGHSYSAGGVAISGGVLNLRGTVIRENSTPSYGGGVYVKESVLNIMDGSLITDCVAFSGGGVFAEGSAVVNIDETSSVTGNINGNNQPNNCAGSGQFTGTCG